MSERSDETPHDELTSEEAAASEGGGDDGDDAMSQARRAVSIIDADFKPGMLEYTLMALMTVLGGFAFYLYLSDMMGRYL